MGVRLRKEKEELRSSGATRARSLCFILHFDALRLVALREGDRNEETLATENERKGSCAHLRTYTQPTQLIAAGASLQPTPIPLWELA